MYTSKQRVSILLPLFLFSTSTSAGELTKPALMTKGFNILHPGFQVHLPPVSFTYDKWSPDWIPEDCKRIADREGRKLSLIETYNVHYADCQSPWILCRSTASPDSLHHLFENFGRVPVHARSHVKGLIGFLDEDKNYAYNDNSFIALFTRPHLQSNLSVLIHETGHSLDVGAYGNHPLLSNSTAWVMEYYRDSHVPDSYAQTNHLENVAQNTVIAAYDLNVPGGFAGVEKGWKGIEHQVGMIKREGKELLVPGGRCTKRVPNSKPVYIGGRKRQLRPNVELDDGLEVIEVGHVYTGPRARAEMPDIGLHEELEVIEPRQLNTRGKCHY